MMATKTYKKRSGTGSVQGQLYESKLISLILFRLLRHKDIHEFYLASNYDGIGAFDDIIFKVEIKEHNRPILVFIQAKHKENDGARLEYDLIKNFYNSYIKVKERFCVKKDNSLNNDLFSGNFSDTDCVFILYTNAKFNRDACDRVPPYKHDLLNNLLLTNKDSQVLYSEYINEDLQILNEKVLEEKIAMLAEHFTKFLNDKSLDIMKDTCILQFHVILAQRVVHISEAQSEDAIPHPEQTKNNDWRTLTFRPDFFYTDDHSIAMLRERIYELILKKKRTLEKNIIRQDNLLPIVSSAQISSRHYISDSTISTLCNSNKPTIDEQIFLFLSEPSAITLSSLIETQIIYKDDELKFIVERPSSDHVKLKKVNVSALLIKEAKAIAAKTMLLSLRLKVPVTFGNIDLTINRNDKKSDRRLKHLINKINNMCERAKFINSYKGVAVKEDDGFSNVNGDMGGFVGNLFIYDKGTKCLMFTENGELLKRNAKFILDNLHTERNDLHLYRFDMKAVANWPKLEFDYSNEVKEILNKVLVFEKQSNHRGVEEILTNEIAIHQNLSHSDLVKPDNKTVFLHFHNRLQEWWIEKELSSFLTKSNCLYEEIINDISEEPQISAMHNMFYMNNVEHFKYNFIEDAMGKLKSLRENLTTIVVTDITILTTMKIIRYLRYNFSIVHSVVDLERMVKLPPEDFSMLINEIRRTKKVLIIVCNDIKRNSILNKRLNNLAEAIKDKTIIIITDDNFYQTVQEYFDHAIVINDEKQCLTDLTSETRTEIIKEANVLFQGYDVNLDMILNDESAVFIKGTVLNKILLKMTTNIGKSLKDEKSSKRYEEMKQRNETYINRRICRSSNITYSDEHYIEYGKDYYTLDTFHDIEDQVVLLSSTAGMGKSILLTHMSHKTSVSDKKLWIVRINLLEHTDLLKKWKENEAVIDSSTMINFICQVTLQNNKIKMLLKESDRKIYLQEYIGDEDAAFELNLFLNFYNETKVIFLFDGFDEICPNYKNEVINLFQAVQNDARRNKMWVTSRPYSEILPDLKSALRVHKSYKIECFHSAEIRLYLETFWHNKIPADSINVKKRNVIDSKLQPTVEESQENMVILEIVKIFKLFLKTKKNDRAAELRRDFVDISKKTHRYINVFLGTPLLLYLLADYFTNVIIDFILSVTDSDADELPITIDIFHMYEKFIENKLTIFFKIKHGARISDPLFEEQYKNELRNCYNIYKRIGALTILRNSLFHNDCRLDEFKNMSLNKENILEIEELINTFKGYEDKTGLISCVTTDNVAIFIHRTFAEYFATEFICDILTSDIDSRSKELLYCAIDLYNPEICTWIRRKLDSNKELDFVIREEIKPDKSMFKLSIYSAYGVFNKRWTIEQNIRVYTSSINDYEPDIEHFINSLRNSDNVPYSMLSNPTVKMLYDTEFVARMKPHLKKYFSFAPSRFTAVHKLKAELSSILKQYENYEKSRNASLYQDI